MTASESEEFFALCDIDGCTLTARWTQTRDGTRIDCPKHPHQPPMAVLHAYLRRLG